MYIQNIHIDIRYTFATYFKSTYNMTIIECKISIVLYLFYRRCVIVMDALNEHDNN